MLLQILSIVLGLAAVAVATNLFLRALVEKSLEDLRSELHPEEKRSGKYRIVYLACLLLVIAGVMVFFYGFGLLP